jgi:hypothetical protein
MNCHAFLARKWRLRTTCHAPTSERNVMKRTAEAVWSGDLKTGAAVFSRKPERTLEGSQRENRHGWKISNRMNISCC